ncbi:MAG: UDP-glucose 4-epimerase GalE [Helicobacteraceae bacterium]|jgi:UDP-glucose 4-epimerase|nr:UDP-glucose 4-epimerase GalE [Helicobacteraceae bacterium]
MKNILVFGGAGYIGSHTTYHLKTMGYNPIVADNLIYGHKESIPKGVSFEKVDLASPSQLEALFKKYKFDAVIHFAAFAYVGESVKEPAKYYRNNVVGTINLLDAMLAVNVKNIVFSSTCATYGEPEYTPIDETHPQNPINPYGQSKLMIEKVFADYERAYGLRWIALRYFNAAGAAFGIGESHNPETHLIPLVLRSIMGGGAINVFGTDYGTPDGTCIRDYIHVLDLANAHRLAIEKLGDFTGALNLGTGVGTSVKEIIAVSEKVSGKKCPVNWAARRDGDPARLFATSGKAREALGWIPEKNIEEIISDAWAWENERKF